MSRTGPVTKDTSTVALGLAKILVGPAVATTNPKDVTATVATNLLSAASHGFAIHNRVRFTGAALPGGIVTGTDYYIISTGFTAGAFSISTVKGSTTALNITSTGTSPITCTRQNNITSLGSVLENKFDSLGALNSTSFTSEVEFWKLESGFPLLEDKVIPLRESAKLECEFKEVNLRNLAFARGLDATNKDYDGNGEIALGTAAEPKYVRMEAIYTYPNKTDKMIIIFPRAQVTSSVNLNFAAEDNMNVPITFEAKAANATSGGHANWDTRPLGIISFITS